MSLIVISPIEESQRVSPVVTRPLQLEPLPGPDISNFSIDGILDLEEHIPIEQLPHYLTVHDQGSLTSGNQYDSRHDGVKPAKWTYRRVYPTSNDINSPDSPTTHFAHLYLSPGHQMGIGHHSIVYHSPLELPSYLTGSNSTSSRPGTVGVVVKLGIPGLKARSYLDNEAEMYNSFPTQFLTRLCSVYQEEGECLLHADGSCPTGPLVPFFGWYLSVHSEDEEPPSESWKRRSPILLLENCGKQIQISALSKSERCAVYYPLLLCVHKPTKLS